MIPPSRRWSLMAVAAVAAAALTAPACISSAPYARLAKAGVAYAGAVESLAGAAGALAVDASSERLLQDDELSNVDLATLRRFDEEDSQRLAVLAHLQAHARLVRRYFALLGDLAAGHAGTSTVTAIARVTAALDSAGEALTGSPGATARVVEPVRTGAAFLGRSLARREVEARAPLLRRELEAQDAVLTAMTATLHHDAALVADAHRQRRVVDPLLAAEPVADPDRWIADRRELLRAKPALDELAAASRAARSLAAALDGLAAAGRADLAAIDGVIADAERINAALAAAGWRKESGS